MAAGDMFIGLDGEFLQGTAGSTPSTEAENVDDVAVKLSSRTAEAVRRGKKFVTKKPTVLEAQLTFKIYVVEGDTFLDDIMSAWINKTRLALYGKQSTSGKGANGDWYITDVSDQQNNGEFISHTVTAELTEELRDFAWE